MPNFIAKTQSFIGNFLGSLSAKRFLVAILTVLVLLTINVNPAFSGQDNDRALGQKLKETIRQGETSDRPRTTGQWNQQAREVEGQPGERLKRIGQQSAEAVKEFGEVYPDTADRSKEAAEGRYSQKSQYRDRDRDLSYRSNR